MEKNSFKTIIMLIISIFFVVFFQTVVYSAFSSSLNVEGNAYARIATDVRVTDFKISEKYSSSNYVSNYENFSKNTVSTYVTFNNSTNVYYDVEVTNYNSNKVGIYSVNGLPEGVSYSFLDYNLGDVIITKQEKIIKVVSGDYDTVGSEICIDTECFYVISSDDTSVTMLSKYNLYVGNECTSIYSCS